MVSAAICGSLHSLCPVLLMLMLAVLHPYALQLCMSVLWCCVHATCTGQCTPVVAVPAECASVPALELCTCSPCLVHSLRRTVCISKFAWTRTVQSVTAVVEAAQCIMFDVLRSCLCIELVQFSPVCLLACPVFRLLLSVVLMTREPALCRRCLSEIACCLAAPESVWNKAS